ncbi:hypothetical protein, partial [uncultured Proteiniphilum sp.]|uniref:hypothetical protein n=1 Tax=uncultured Proteiniphilum sp. TaxID=497637 RepID=UPI002639BD63
VFFLSRVAVSAYLFFVSLIKNLLSTPFLFIDPAPDKGERGSYVDDPDDLFIPPYACNLVNRMENVPEIYYKVMRLLRRESGWSDLHDDLNEKRNEKTLESREQSQLLIFFLI